VQNPEVETSKKIPVDAIFVPHSKLNEGSSLRSSTSHGPRPYTQGDQINRLIKLIEVVSKDNQKAQRSLNKMKAKMRVMERTSVQHCDPFNFPSIVFQEDYFVQNTQEEAPTA